MTLLTPSFAYSIHAKYKVALDGGDEEVGGWGFFSTDHATMPHQHKKLDSPPPPPPKKALIWDLAQPFTKASNLGPSPALHRKFYLGPSPALQDTDSSSN